MKNLEKFILDIKRVMNKLHSLDKEYSEIHKSFSGTEFDTQNKCSAKIDNSILMLTHEVETQMGFAINDLEILLQYIKYRKKYSDYNSEELSDLIDDRKLNIVKRREILKNKKEKNLMKIVSDWNITFNNDSYYKIMEQLNLKK